MITLTSPTSSLPLRLWQVTFTADLLVFTTLTYSVGTLWHTVSTQKSLWLCTCTFHPEYGVVTLQTGYTSHDTSNYPATDVSCRDGGSHCSRILEILCANFLSIHTEVNVIDAWTNISLELTTMGASHRASLMQQSRTNATELHLNMARAIHLHHNLLQFSLRNLTKIQNTLI